MLQYRVGRTPTESNRTDRNLSSSAHFEDGRCRESPAPRRPERRTMSSGPCAHHISFYAAAPGGGKGSHGMKPLVISVVAGAVVFAGPMIARAQSADMEATSITETEGLPRLPNVFRDCWEPLPAHCVRPPGLLWFGSSATLERERRAAAHRSRRILAAISR